MTMNNPTRICLKSERDMLKTFRYFLLAFANGSQSHWETAMSIAKGEHGMEKGRDVGFAMLRVLQTVRDARENPFLFINPGCEKCARNLLDCERYLMEAIKNLFEGQSSKANVPLMLLCEGSDTKAVKSAIDKLSEFFIVKTKTENVLKSIVKSISK
ncbi:MAG: hypothetical protein ABJG95_12795 [Rhizobiaceae bacterium]